MTLHWWMHWFWITYHLYVCGCTRVTSPMYSVSSELQETTFNFSSSNYDKPMEGSTNSPPVITPTAVIFTKISKLLQKQEFYGSLTNLSSVITENPVVKEITVIGSNFTDMDLNITDSSSFSNTSLITLNHAENVSYITEEIGMNQSIILNSERIGVEKQESVKGNLSAAGITGITLGCVSLIGIVCGGIFFVYRNYGSNRPQVLNDHCSNPDSSGYIDDSSVRENSEEMYSLDNDSFLNSLEAMTIQNLWTDTVKHTKL